ncbi:MAG: hypothetical protein AMJ56_19560 [Anaerolineae bacterium SG8_19]|jgi:hypothetical protein|nr:MAG: hypothetical protein AMJ56_19560 [Anaerolineae bacterium SG8_19]
MTQHGDVIDVREQEAEKRHRWISNLVIALVIAVFLAATIYVVISSVELRETTPVEVGSSVSLSTNPELMVAGRYASAAAERAEALLLRQNPELGIARRYPETASLPAVSTYFYANPELNAYRSYQASTTAQRDASFLTTNPEVKVYRMFIAQTE